MRLHPARDLVRLRRCGVFILFLWLTARMYAAPGPQWATGLTELDDHWQMHEGDDGTWSNPAFDDKEWEEVNLENLGPAQAGSRWFRRRINIDFERSGLKLLISGGDGTYELYINGVRVQDTALLNSFAVKRPAERVFSLGDGAGEGVIALRTRVPAGYAAWHLPQFLAITVGQPTAAEYERQALERARMYPIAPSAAINILLCLAGFGALALFANRRGEREYLFLGLYLCLLGASGLLATLQSSGTLPLSANFLIADPLIYFCVTLQIEFTFRFIRERPSWLWRVYEVALVIPLALAALTWFGMFASDRYVLFEALITAPAGLMLSAVLLIRYRRGVREAGWLILPSLAPAISNALLDLGTASILLGWGRFDRLTDPIMIGPIPLQATDLGSLAFLLSISVVMLFRFAKVNREQARVAAEIDAAREIQLQMVSAGIPDQQYFRIDAAFLPAQEVGGDFYQVFQLADESTLVVIGDVSGKGLKAAMTGTLAIGALRTLVRENLSPGELLHRLNRELVGTQDSGFVTCLCAQFKPSGEICFANAGHLSPYLNGKEIATDADFPLGIVVDARFSETSAELQQGDVLTILSDGVVEARNQSGELFGFERTRSISTESATRIAAAALTFGQEDDITVISIAIDEILSKLHQESVLPA